MRSALLIAIVAAFALIGCSATPKSYREHSEVLPYYKPVSEGIIDDLPERIQRLPVTDSMRGSEFLAALGLEDYVGNLSGGVRFSSCYLELDETHTLQIRCDPDSLVVRREDIDQILLGGPEPQGGSRLSVLGCKVVGCTLRENGNHVIVHRQLTMPMAEQGAAADRQQPSNFNPKRPANSRQQG